MTAGRPALGLLSVGIARADPLHLGRALQDLHDAGVRALHLDVMDGRFAGPLAEIPRSSAPCPSTSAATST